MTPDLWSALLNFAVKFGIEAALAIAKRINTPNATAEDAIKALEEAATKTTDDYLSEAKKELAQLDPPPETPIPGVSAPVADPAPPLPEVLPEPTKTD